MKKIGRYDIVGELGRGAMGVVYKASDPTIGRLVALKVLSLAPSEEKGAPSAQDIFMREARAAGRLTHPAIVTIHDAFEDPETKSSCIVMELIQGRTLESMLLSEPPLPLEQALEIARQVAQGLEYAHQEHVIHRDMKPANILLTAEGRVKITDFGIAKITAREGAVRTVGVMGTPSYMSPEQVTGGEVDPRTDLFSLGIILFLMLTGQKPFLGDTAAVMYKIVYEDPVLPSVLNPRLGPAHDFVIRRLLAKDRSKRYASAREFVDDLDDLQHGRLPRSQAAFSAQPLPAPEPTVISRTPVLAGAKPVAAVDNRKTLRLAVCAGLVVLGAVLGFGYWKFHQAMSPVLPPPPPPLSATLPPPPPMALTTSATPNPATSEAGAASTAPSGNQASESTEREGTKTKRIRKAHAKSSTSPAPVTGAGPPPPVPATVAPPPRPKPAEAPPPAAPVPSKPAVPRTVQLVCTHDFKEVTLTVSSGSQVLFQGKLKGKKKGGFLGIKSSYMGTISKPITVPGGARDLSVRVVTEDGSVDLSKSVPAIPPAGSSSTLQVAASSEHLSLRWQPSAPSKP